MQMAGEPTLTPDHDKILKPRAPRDPDLTGENAASPENDVVPDLHQIINHRASANHGVGSGSSIDRGVGADVHIIANQDPAELGDFDRTRPVRRETEPVLADPYAWVQYDARANHAMTECDIGANPTVVANFYSGADYCVWPDPAPPP
jgi:hypothetical protein